MSQKVASRILLRFCKQCGGDMFLSFTGEDLMKLEYSCLQCSRTIPTNHVRARINAISKHHC